MNNKCIYYVEGPCEQQLIAVLKEAPERLIPGKIKVFNVVQNLIPKSQMSENHFFPQVLNLEDELVRCTDVRTAMELTKSGSVKNFKTDFCKMKAKDRRSMLERHKLDYAHLWMTKTPEAFSFVENNSSQIKTL